MLNLFLDVVAYAVMVLVSCLISSAFLGMFEKTRLAKTKIYPKMKKEQIESVEFIKFKKQRGALAAVGMTLFVIIALFECLSIIAMIEGKVSGSMTSWIFGTLIGVCVALGGRKETKFISDLRMALKENGITRE